MSVIASGAFQAPWVIADIGEVLPCTLGCWHPAATTPGCHCKMLPRSAVLFGALRRLFLLHPLIYFFFPLFKFWFMQQSSLLLFIKVFLLCLPDTNAWKNKVSDLDYQTESTLRSHVHSRSRQEENNNKAHIPTFALDQHQSNPEAHYCLAHVQSTSFDLISEN